MLRWSLKFQKGAEDDLVRLDTPIRRRVIEKLDWLIENFDTVIPLALGAKYREFYKLRVGDWRIMYKVDWKRAIITVCYIDRRDRIYTRGKG